jgi:hypothetical protein
MADRLDDIKSAHSDAEIRAAATPAGGFSRASFEKLGVPYPPPAGWRKRLIENWNLIHLPSARVSAGGAKRETPSNSAKWAAALEQAKRETARNVGRINAGVTFAGQAHRGREAAPSAGRRKKT